MKMIAVVRNRIIQLAHENHITINKLAEISGIAPASLKNILYGKSNNPKLITIKISCDGLGITLAKFFNTKDFNELEQHIK